MKWILTRRFSEARFWMYVDISYYMLSLRLLGPKKVVFQVDKKQSIQQHRQITLSAVACPAAFLYICQICHLFLAAAYLVSTVSTPSIFAKNVAICDSRICQSKIVQVMNMKTYKYTPFRQISFGSFGFNLTYVIFWITGSIWWWLVQCFFSASNTSE